MNPRLIAVLAAMALAAPALAQTWQLPPSVAATPIEIPGDRPGTKVNPPDPGQVGATPIEIPMPIPDPIFQPIVRHDKLPHVLLFDEADSVKGKPVKGSFALVPSDLPEGAVRGKKHGLAHALLPDGSIYGDTPIGYGRFASLADYEAFVARMSETPEATETE